MGARDAVATRVEVGDIVLARVAGTTYLQLVSAVDHPRARIQITDLPGEPETERSVR